MDKLQKLKDFFKDDLFACETCGIEIISAESGRAVCKMTAGEKHKNAGGTVQGGAIFTLADFCFAVAANYGGELCVSAGNTISFVAPGRYGDLFAETALESETSRMCFYRVTVTDGEGKKIALMQVTGSKRGAKNGL